MKKYMERRTPLYMEPEYPDVEERPIEIEKAKKAYPKVEQ